MKFIRDFTSIFTTLKTKNTIKAYFEISSVNDIELAFSFCNKEKIGFYILGGGSNTFFSKSKINCAVLKNKLPEEIFFLDDGTIWCSSSVHCMKMLRFFLQNNYIAPYFLASLPAQLGGLIAMNAGRGGQDVISSYLQSVTFYDGSNIITKPTSDLNFQERSSVFLSNPHFFILGACFNMSKKDFSGEDPISARIKWSIKNQDHSAPNVGCFFSYDCDRYVLFVLSKIFRFGKSRFSKEKRWLLNNNTNPVGIYRIYLIAKLLCRIFFRKFKTEVRIVK